MDYQRNEDGSLVLDADNNPVLTEESSAQLQTQATAAAEVEAVRGTATAAVEAYRAVVVAANPGIPARLIVGSTPDEVQASLDAATQLVAEIQAAAPEAKKPPIGFRPGAPAKDARQEPAPSNPHDKIAAGLAAARQQ